MAKKTTSNTNDFLFQVKKNTSHKIYPLLVDLAEIITKIDYLLEYTSTCIKQKDFREAKESIKKVEDRMKILKDNNVDTDYLDYLYEGIKKKIK